MKVLMTADAIGGVWTYASELCRMLTRDDVEVVLATMGPAPKAAQREAIAAIPNVRLHVGPWKLEWMEHPWDDVARAGEWLLDLAAHEQIDLVHLNGYAHAALAWQRPVVVVAHSCVCSWWRAVHGEPAPSQWDRYREAVAHGLKSADAVVAPTHAFLMSVEDNYGALRRSTVIHNARARSGAADSCEKLPLIFACGRAWDPAKNLHALDAAARDLAWPVYVAGERESPDGRASAFTALKCLGMLSARDVDRALSRAAIFAHPARYEPFGLAVLEAALHGCALVLSDLPTLRELWDGAALFVDPNDASSLRAQLQSLIERPDECALLGRSAQDRARRYEPQAMGAAYLELYRDLAHHHEPKERAVA